MEVEQDQQLQDSLKEQQDNQHGDINIATSSANELSAQQDFEGVATPDQFAKDVKTPTIHDVHMNQLRKAQESITKEIGNEGLFIIICSLVFFIGLFFKRK